MVEKLEEGQASLLEVKSSLPRAVSPILFLSFPLGLSFRFFYFRRFLWPSIETHFQRICDSFMQKITRERRNSRRTWDKIETRSESDRDRSWNDRRILVESFREGLNCRMREFYSIMHECFVYLSLSLSQFLFSWGNWYLYVAIEMIAHLLRTVTISHEERKM